MRIVCWLITLAYLIGDEDVRWSIANSFPDLTRSAATAS